MLNIGLFEECVQCSVNYMCVILIPLGPTSNTMELQCLEAKVFRNNPGLGEKSLYFIKDCPIFRSRARSPDLGNAILGLFRPIRIDIHQVSAQTVDSEPKR